MGGKSSAPPAPDYTGAANAQAAASQELATQQTWANRPTQVTPWGTTSWGAQAGVDPATGQTVNQWTQYQTLDPNLQGALNDQLAIQQGRSQLAGGFMGRVGDAYAQPFDWQNLPQAAQTPLTQQTQGRNMMADLPAYQLDINQRDPSGLDTSRLNTTTQTTNAPAFADERQRIEQGLLDRMRPEQNYQQDRLQTQLANQGLTPGSTAYNRELQRLGDQQSRERFNAMEMGGQEQARMQQMLLGQQQQAFGQAGTAQEAYNRAMQQQFGQNLQSQDAYNRALAQQQQIQQNAGNFYNQAQNQMFGQDLSANQQNYQQMMQQAAYQNQLRQQAIAEQAQARGMSLNEMNALLTGQQVGTPQMPSFMGASSGQAPNLLGAATAQGQYNLGATQQQNQQNAGLWGGLGSLAGASMPYIFGL